MLGGGMGAGGLPGPAYGGAMQGPPPPASLLAPFPSPNWAELVQRDDWRQLGIVDIERARAMTEQDILQSIQTARQNSATARRGLEDEWRRMEDLYHLRTFDRMKQPWQARVKVPEVQTKLRVTLSQLQGVLLDAPQWFQVLNEPKTYYEPQTRLLQHWLGIVVEQARTIENVLAMWEQAFLLGTGFLRVSVDNFVERRPHVMQPDPMEVEQWQMQMQQWQQAAMAMGPQAGPPPQPPRPYVSTMSMPRNQFRTDFVSAWCVYPDPYAGGFYKGKFVIEESAVDEEDLQARVDAGIYDSLDGIGEPVSWDATRESRYRRTELLDSRAMSRRQHLLQRYVGNLYDKDGRIVCENWCFDAVNEKALVRACPNPLWRGQNGYICSTPLPYHGRPWGMPLCDADSRVQEQCEKVLNLMIDDAMYAVLGIFLMDETKCDEPSTPEHLWPGKIYRGREEFVRKINFQTQINNLWPLYNKLEQIGQSSTQISEFIDGSPSSRGRPTATEVQSKTSAGTAYLHNVARRLEENDLERLLNLVKDFILQFGNDAGDPRLSDLLEQFGGPGAAQFFQDQVTRFETLNVPTKIQVRGISMMMARQDLMQRLMQLMSLGQQLGIPPMNMLKIFYTAISTLGFDPEQLDLPDTPEGMQQMQQQMMLQQQAQAAGAAPGGGGSGTGPPAPVASNSGQPPPSSDALAAQAQAQGPPIAA